MALSTAKRTDLPDMPDIASVLRAIHDDTTERRDSSDAQNELFRSLMKMRHPLLPEDELKDATKRLRSKVVKYYNENARRPIRRTKMQGKSKHVWWEAKPFAELFYGGLYMFPRTHLNKLGIDIGWHPDDDNRKEDTGVATMEGGSQHKVSTSDHVSGPSSGDGSNINIGTPKKRKINEVQPDAVPQVSEAPRTKRLQLRVTSASGDAAVLRAQSQPPSLKLSNGRQSQRQPAKSQEPAAIGPETQAAGRNATSRVAKIANRHQHNPAGESAKSSRPMEPDRVQRTTPQQPVAISVQNVIVPHAGWVKAQMKIIEESIWEAALAYFQEKGKDDKAVPNFVHTPEPGLELLYEHVFGTNWQVRLGDIEDLGPHLKQIYVTMALFGAAIHTAVLAQDSSWDCRAQLDAELGAYRRYLEAALENRVPEPERFLDDVACVQASDRDYQTTVVAKQARRLAGSTAMTMQPHFRQLSRRTAMTEEFEFQHWILHLEEAFRAAITLKQIITSSHLGPFEIRWPRSGEPVDLGIHRLRYNLAKKPAEGFTTTVMHGM
ncbi:hypothetical protein CKM354_000975900 [Cercospora kikuchii]|uniref:Uncharacterized protein n=1 Tax=Cercospora kikuchii TaxID=84275 RepID=A0A9P3CU18_9PEZI|nr:uncharacterized protein CKM354_000975900 [Cercospora kikuchii]GIZ46640.1 hypothetical protein CKM354_000975900 [Cercospora kikuchii]